MAEDKYRLNIELDQEELAEFDWIRDVSNSKSRKRAFLLCMKSARYLLSNKLKKVQKDGTLADVDVLL